jgi:plastocyanin
MLGAIRGRMSPAPAHREASTERSIVFAVPLDAKPEGASRATHTVGVHEGVFSPAFVAIAAGHTVQFANQDSIYHRVFSSSAPNAFDLGVFAPSTSASVELSTPGLVRLYCLLHERERGTVFVAPNSFFDLVDPPGTFAIEGLAPGRYDLRVWSEAGDDAAAPLRVIVNAGRATSVELAIAEGVQAE